VQHFDGKATDAATANCTRLWWRIQQTTAQIWLHQPNSFTYLSGRQLKFRIKLLNFYQNFPSVRMCDCFWRRSTQLAILSLTKQAMHVQCNMGARSRNHCCCRGKASSITYSGCVRILTRPACKAYGPYCHLWPAWLSPCFPTLPHKRHDLGVGGGVTEHKMYVLTILCNFCLKHFSFYEEMSEIWSKMYVGIRTGCP